MVYNRQHYYCYYSLITNKINQVWLAAIDKLIVSRETVIEYLGGRFPQSQVQKSLNIDKRNFVFIL